jgi:hypothetical protein
VNFIIHGHPSSLKASFEDELSTLLFDMESKQVSWVVGRFHPVVVHMFAGHNVTCEGEYQRVPHC